MSAQAGDPPPAWTCPPPEECEEGSPYTVCPDGADPAKHRIMLRLVSHVSTDELVRFAVIQQTYSQGEWRHVAMADSCHDVDVHLHQYGRRSDARVGDPEVLLPVTSANDIHRGYDLAYTRVVEGWVENHRRWQDA